jgi:hypothetical protein
MLIPARKKAATVYTQVGINNPEGPICIVDAVHKVCFRVDANDRLAAATEQLIFLYTALWWVTWPTERGGYVVKITAGERRTLICSSSSYRMKSNLSQRKNNDC